MRFPPAPIRSNLWEAEWAKRPVGARDMPPASCLLTPGRLAWAYVRRTDRDLLPQRYRTLRSTTAMCPGCPCAGCTIRS